MGHRRAGFQVDQASFLVDAFAEVFASLAISSPAPIESSNSVSELDHTSEEVSADDASHSEDSVQNDSQQSVVDDTGNGSESARFLLSSSIQSQVAGSGESVEDEETGEILVLGATIDSDETSDETPEFDAENRVDRSSAASRRSNPFSIC